MPARIAVRPVVRRLGVLAVLTLVLAVASAASAATEDGAPTYGVRLYEVFQRGSRLVMEERTSRAFAPRQVRNLGVGEVFPAEGEAPLKVFKGRDHLDYFGSYWREDGTPGKGEYEVEVWEDKPADEPGVAYVRIRLVQRSGERPVGASRRVMHPEHDDAQRKDK